MRLLLKFALFVLFNLLLGLLVALNSVKYITCGTLIDCLYVLLYFVTLTYRKESSRY